MHIFFDVDGTLIDHMGAARAAALEFLDHFSGVLPFEREAFVALWNTLAGRHYARYLAGQVDFQGQRRNRVKEVFALAHQPITDETADQHVAVYLASYEAHWQLFPDVLPALDALRGRRLSVITNNHSSQQKVKLARAGILERFELALSADMAGAAKPHPAIFLEACRRAQVRPDESVYVGDELETDAVASCAAGLRGVWINRGASADCPPQVTAIHDLRELPELVSRGLHAQASIAAA